MTTDPTIIEAKEKSGISKSTVVLIVGCMLLVFVISLSVSFYKNYSRIRTIEKSEGFVETKPGFFLSWVPSNWRLSLQNHYGDDCLRPFESVTGVYLNKSKLGDEGVIISSAFEDLNFAYLNKGVTDEGLSYLQDNLKLKQVLIDSPHVTDKGLSYFSHLNDMEILTAENTHNITDSSLAKIRGMTSLRQLAFTSNQITNEGIANLAGMTKMEMLYLTNSQITEDGLKHLASMKDLQFLMLRNSSVTDSSMIHVKSFPKLVGIDLGQTKITDEGVKHLRMISGLRTLLLDGTFVTKDVLEVLKEMKNLKMVRLNKTNLSYSDIKHLRKHKPGCQIYGP